MASKRLRHVLKVFSSVGLLSYREKHLPQDQQTTPVKLRQAFEQLGPSFVKIGQILSTRSDLLSEAYIRELSKLQSSVPPLNKEEVMTAIRQESQLIFLRFSSIFLKSLWPLGLSLRPIEQGCCLVRK